MNDVRGLKESSDGLGTATREASAWYARFQSGTVTASERADFEAWLHRDQTNLQEFQALDAFWDDLSHIAQSAEVQQARRRAQVMAVQPRPGPWIVNYIDLRKLLPKWALVPVFTASCAALLVIALNYPQLANIFSHGETYQTALGEQRRIELADTSVVMLNTQTELRVHYSDSERRIELLKGQAFFDVRSDSRRPFLVTAADGKVRALGTAFDVYKQSARVTVTLVEGKVEVSQNSRANIKDENEVDGSTSHSEQKVYLQAGEQVIYQSSNTSGPLTAKSVDPGRITAWRENKLNFFDTPLEEAIAEANRYSRVKIVLASEELKTKRISGAFTAGRNDLVAEGIQAYFGLNISRPSERAIVLQTKR